MNKLIAEKIKKAAAPYMSTNYNSVNIFLKDDEVDVEPVTGSWGAGIPANPERYTQFWLSIPLGWLEDTSTIMESLQ